MVNIEHLENNMAEIKSWTACRGKLKALLTIFVKCVQEFKEKYVIKQSKLRREKIKVAWI